MIKDGMVQCGACSGSGKIIVSVFKHCPYEKMIFDCCSKCNDNNNCMVGSISCLVCKGKGKVDWVTRITRKDDGKIPF